MFEEFRCHVLVNLFLNIFLYSLADKPQSGIIVTLSFQSLKAFPRDSGPIRNNNNNNNNNKSTTNQQFRVN